MADVTVSFGAVDAGLSAAIANIRAQLGTINIGVGPGGGGGGGGGVFPPAVPINVPGAGGGGAFPPPLGQINAAVGATNQLNAAITQTGQAAQRSGIDIGYMFERMIVRMGIALVIFGTIREAIKLMQDAMKFETAETQLKNLTGGGQAFENELRAINREFEVTHTNRSKLIDIEKQLYSVGIPMQNLAGYMQEVDQYAKATGEDAGKMIHTIASLRLGRASIDEMYEMTKLMGDQGVALHGQIEQYEKMEAELPRIQREQELNLRLTERQWQLLDRQRDATYRLTDAQSDFAGQVGITQRLFQMMQQGADPYAAARAASFVGGLRLDKAAQVEANRLKAGEQQIEQEEGLSEAEVRRLERMGLINAKTLEAAAQRKREQQDIAIQQEREDERFSVQMGMELMRYNLEQQGLALQTQTLAGLNQFVGLSTQLTNTLGTTASAFDKMAQDLAKLVEDMPQLLQALEKIANFLDSMINKAKDVPEAMNKGLKQTTDTLDVIDKKVKEIVPIIPEKGIGEGKGYGEEEKKIPTGPAPTDTEAWLDKKMSQQQARVEQWAAKGKIAAGGWQPTEKDLMDVGMKELMKQPGMNRPDLYYTPAEIKAVGKKALGTEQDYAKDKSLQAIYSILQSVFTIATGA